jgi:hypothetical protein
MEGPKILKYTVSFCVYDYESSLYFTSLCLIRSMCCLCLQMLRNLIVFISSMNEFRYVLWLVCLAQGYGES